MESVIPCGPNGSGDSILSSTDPQQAVDYRNFCYTLPILTLLKERSGSLAGSEGRNMH